MVMGELTSYNEQFEKIVNIIESAKERAYRKVNEELILMYRDVGEYISKQSERTGMVMHLCRNWLISLRRIIRI